MRVGFGTSRTLDRRPQPERRARRGGGGNRTVGARLLAAGPLRPDDGAPRPRRGGEPGPPIACALPRRPCGARHRYARAPAEASSSERRFASISARCRSSASRTRASCSACSRASRSGIGGRAEHPPAGARARLHRRWRLPVAPPARAASARRADAPARRAPGYRQPARPASGAWQARQHAAFSSTTTAFDRPPEKLWRTVSVSRFSESGFRVRQHAASCRAFLSYHSFIMSCGLGSPMPPRPPSAPS